MAACNYLSTTTVGRSNVFPLGLRFANDIFEVNNWERYVVVPVLFFVSLQFCFFCKVS